MLDPAKSKLDASASKFKQYDSHNDVGEEMDDEHAQTVRCARQAKKMTDKPNQVRRFNCVVGGIDPKAGMRKTFEEYKVSGLGCYVKIAETGSSGNPYEKKIWSNHQPVDALDLPLVPDENLTTVAAQHLETERAILDGTLRKLTTFLDAPMKRGETIYVPSGKISGNKEVITRIENSGFVHKIYIQGTVERNKPGPGQIGPYKDLPYTIGSFNANKSDDNGALYVDAILENLKYRFTKAVVVNGQFIKTEPLLQVPSMHEKLPNFQNTTKQQISKYVASWTDSSRKEGQSHIFRLRGAANVPDSITQSEQLTSYMDMFRAALASVGFPEKAELAENKEKIRKFRASMPDNVELTDGQVLMLVKTNAIHAQALSHIAFPEVKKLYPYINSPEDLVKKYDEATALVNKYMAKVYFGLPGKVIDGITTTRSVFSADKDVENGGKYILRGKGYVYNQGFKFQDENKNEVICKGFKEELKNNEKIHVDPSIRFIVKNSEKYYDNGVVTETGKSPVESLSEIIVQSNYRHAAMDTVSENAPSAIKELNLQNRITLGSLIEGGGDLSYIDELKSMYLSHKEKALLVSNLRRRYEDAGFDVVPDHLNVLGYALKDDATPEQKKVVTEYWGEDKWASLSVDIDKLENLNLPCSDRAKLVIDLTKQYSRKFKENRFS